MGALTRHDLDACSQVLARLCHEVRTPLHGILGCLELLAANELDDESRALVQAAHDAARRLHEGFEQEIELARRQLIR